MSNRKKRPPLPPPGKSVTVQPGAYPVFTSTVAMALLRAVRDPHVAAEAARIVTDSADGMRSCACASATPTWRTLVAIEDDRSNARKESRPAA